MSHQPQEQNVLTLATALIVNTRKQVLLVRKKGTTAFMQAGGKIAPQETSLEALIRELKEELDYTITPQDADYIGCLSAPAAHEPGYMLAANCYFITCTQPLSAQAEIEEIIWVDPFSSLSLPLAPLTQEHILPLALHLLSNAG